MSWGGCGEGKRKLLFLVGYPRRGEESAEERFGSPYLLRGGSGVSSGPVKGR